MANLKAEFHEHLTRPGIKYDEEMSICLLESDLKISKYHANVVSVEENVSNLNLKMTGLGKSCVRPQSSLRISRVALAKI